MAESDPVPGDYDSDDAYDEEQGLEQCPHCERIYSFNGGLTGPVHDKAGRRFEYYTDTDPGTVFFCPGCWPELRRNKRQDENASLDSFGGGADGE